MAKRFSQCSHDDLKGLTQKDIVLLYLNEFKFIGPLDAWLKCGVYRLGAVIFELKEDGHNIENVGQKVRNRFGREMRVGRYELHR